MNRMNRRRFLQQLGAGAAFASLGAVAARAAENGKRPNILFAIADDWSWPHASAYGATGVKTPAFDRIAAEGVLFNNAFTAAPQCSPNRAATLTGRAIWQIEEAGTHASIFPQKYQVFPDLLERAGYHAGFTGKGWGPGDWKRGGWERNPAGPEYSKKVKENVPYDGIHRMDYAANFELFLDAKPADAPFFFWFGGYEPHRKYQEGSGLAAGKSLDDAEVPGFLPDTTVVRSDILDYFVEVEWFDEQLVAALRKLEELGELDNTIVVATSDNGMPFPRAKANLYEYGTHVPMAIMWPDRAEGGRVTDALVSFVDLGPTFLDAAGIAVPQAMTGRSFLPVLTGTGPGPRDYVLTGRERHTHARYDNWGYPSRAIRTDEFLYIRNFRPDRWPAGDPDEFYDIDGSPTKSLLLENREEYGKYVELAVGKRPEEELFAVKEDPCCLNNLAGNPEYANVQKELSTRLMRLLKEQGDPRALGTGDIFESYPRVSGMRPELGGFAARGEYNSKYQPKE